MKANLLKAEIAKAEMTQTSLASAIGMSPQTLSKRLKSGKFNLEEAQKIIKILRLENGADIFLPKN